MTAGLAPIGTTAEGAPFAVDVDQLIGSHALAVANSGGGKSGLLRRFLEATHGTVQQIVIDPEDQLYTLRERYNYIIVGGEGADAPVSVDGAAELALLALRHGLSMIVQPSELGAAAPDFVDAFLGGLMSAPQDLWRPLLVGIDELQRFAPPGRAAGVEDLVFRGRKRGYTLLGASLRITKVDPSVRGMVNNWMLGRVSQTLDRNTMADQLGFTAKEGREKLRALQPREFWCFGPALTLEPTLFTVGDTATTIVRRGQARLPTPPAPEALREILQGLAAAATAPSKKGRGTPADSTEAFDAGAEAGELLKQKDARIRELEDRVAALEADVAVAADVEKAFEFTIGAVRRALENAPKRATREQAGRDKGGGLTPPQPVAAGQEEARAQGKRREERASSDSVVEPPAPIGNLPPRRQRILDALTWCETFLGRPAVPRAIAAYIADTTPSSSTFEKDCSAMRTRDLVVYPANGELALTDEGRAAARRWEAPPTREALFQAIASKLPPRRVRILEELWSGDVMRRTDLANVCGTSADSSTFEKDLSAMRPLGLVDYPRAGEVELVALYRDGGRG